MATVYVAHDAKHDRQVALKVLHPELAVALGPERFQREIRTTARLHHPHILPVLDSGEAGGQLWYTMPFVDGESLRARLNRDRQLPLEDALQITREVADALGYAHSQGVVHRDIKPENILLSRGHALVADFGVARAVQAAGGDQLTETGMSVGTPAYMSPEQSLADPSLDGRSDLYSLGCVLYEMLAGETPYAGTSAQAILAKRLREPVPHVRTVRETVPPSIDRALERVLAKAPADRFPSAEAFAKVLREETLNAGAHAQSPRSDNRAGKWLQRPQVLAMLGMLVIATLSAVWWQRNRVQSLVSEGSANSATRLAVLPFTNIGDSADDYFADGVTDEIRGKLAAIPGLEVIASSSSTPYRGSPKRPDQIARELSVGYLLTGRVRWEKVAQEVARVRVHPELIQVSSGPATTKWQQPFDAALTDVFKVQADIATRVAQELELTLAPATARVLTERPTASLEAYDAYLRAQEYERSRGATADILAIRSYQEAVAKDSTFALAWAGLAWIYVRKYRAFPDPSDARRLREIIDKVLGLAPDLPDGHARDGEFYTFVHHDNAQALAAYNAGLRLAPSNALLLNRAGWAEMRLGRWGEAVNHLREAARLDPRSTARLADLSTAYVRLRRYDEAKEVVERGLSIDPSSPSLISAQARISLCEGDLSTARKLLRQIPPTVNAGVVLADQDVWVLDTTQLQTLAAASQDVFGNDDARRSLALTEVYWRLGEQSKAKSYADSAKRAYELAIGRTPDAPDLHSQLGLVLAYLGEHERAVESGLRAVSMLPIERDAIAAGGLQERLARIYVLSDQHGRAVDLLERLLRQPGWLSPQLLSVHPLLSQLRRDPRFQRLIATN
jgi:serine/threonine-protein kinase